MFPRTKFCKVNNRDKYRSANPIYFQVQDEHKVDYLFTQHDLKDARDRAARNREDLAYNNLYFTANPNAYLNGVFCGSVVTLVGVAIGICVAILI